MMPKPRKAFLICAALAGVVGIVTMLAATQYAAHTLGYQRALGAPIGRIETVPVYAPWACVQWSGRFEHLAPRVFSVVQAIGFGGGLVAFLIFLLGISRLNEGAASTAHGSARWAEREELEKAGILDDAGVVLCQTSDARFTSRPDGQGGQKWALGRPGTLIRHAGSEHVLVFAPTRSGKGIGTVIPTLLSWPASVVVYDIKKELWSMTAGWRRKFSHCWRFEPTGTDGVHYNPLFEIRRGTNEVRDAQTVAEILIDPEGKTDKDHWKISGASLLTAAILHVLYAEDDKSLTGVSAFLSDPNRSQIETLKRMLTTQHLPGGAHPVVAQTARAMISKSANELSGVLSTAKAALTLYDDPMIATSTRTSDFRIADLMNAANPVSLYLVVPPSDIERTKPLVRLLLQQFGKRLTEKMSSGYDSSPAYRHRLLMLLDEFPSLGRLNFFESALAFAAGYGIKCFLICQSLNQLEQAYGRDNSIVDNCHVRMAYAANRSETAKTISELMGQATASKRHRSVSGKGLFGTRSVSESNQEFARPLMTPDEVLRLPYDEALLFVGGLPPYRARKLMYYLDERFAERVDPRRFPPPESRRRQKAELLAAPSPVEWDLPAVPAAPRSDVAAGTDPAEPTPVAVEEEEEALPSAGLTEAWRGFFTPEATDDVEPSAAPPRRPGTLPL